MAHKLIPLVLLALIAQVFAPVPTHATTTQPYGLDAMLQLDRLPYLKWDTLAGGQSSYDRMGNNIDHNNYAYTDKNGDNVMLDLQGPGTVYRMWFTGFVPDEANIKVYFDGETTPRINMLIRDLVAGNHPPFLAPLVGNDAVSSGGYYSYVPLPFNKSIKIVTNQNAWMFYYNIGYHLYGADTPVTTWTPSQDTTVVRDLYRSAGSDPISSDDNAIAQGTLNLPAGATRTLLDLAGPRSISAIKLRVPGIVPGVQLPAAADILNGLWIKIYWDDETFPSVSASIGSFFAIGQFGTYATRSLMAGLDDAGNLYMYFPMPFQNHARIQLVSARSADTNNIAFEIRHAPFTDSFADVGYFKTAFNFQTRNAGDGQDLLLLDVTGAGQLVGIVGSFVGPVDHTFLEGDERVYVDDSPTPVIQGTGTEDFFNAGWYFKNGSFTLPTHGLTGHAPGGGLDRMAAYRLFLQDAIPFRTHLRMSLEHGNRNDTTMDAWTLAYYYDQPAPRALLTDVLDIGDSVSESSHYYAIDKAVWSGTRNFTYDGVMDGESTAHDGRAHKGSSRFQMAISLVNEGVLLRRKLDQGIANQKATVWVDGQSVGPWYTAGSNLYHRWRDDDFLIPAAYTRGKSAITIQLVAAPGVDWNEFQYLAYSLVNPAASAPVSVSASTGVLSLIPRGCRSSR